MELLREKAKAIASFAGRIQYRMPADIYSRLLRYEVFMT